MNDVAQEVAQELEAAVAVHREGRIDEAEPVYRRILAERPEHAEARHMLGVAQLQRGRFEEAVASLREAIGRDPADARYRNNLGNALMGLARPEEALEAFGEAFERDAGFLTALYNRGTAFYALRRLDEAEDDFRAVLSRQPDSAKALNNLGAVLVGRNRPADAADCFRRLRDQNPENPDTLINLASALEKLNDLDGAEAAARQALAIDPERPAIQYLLASLENRAGRFADAKARLEALLARPLADEQRCDALFELGLALDGLALDGLGEAGAAFAAFATFADGNARVERSPAARRFRADRYLEQVESNRRWFTAERLRAFSVDKAADPSEGLPRPGTAAPPVFFVGFPRSGTTLMERALQAHPEIVTTDEASPLHPVRRWLEGRGAYPEVLEDLGGGELAGARAQFWVEAERLAGSLSGRRLVDKLPLNIVELGLANALFPEARVVVALRDPRDVCLSCFMQRFRLNDAMASFLDLERTARTYAAVMDLWLHYRETLGLAWHEYRYEDLVEDFEGTVRGVLDFIGAGWHDDVARYRELAAEQVMTTPSYRAAAGPLDGRSIGRWRAYRAQLAPILPTLAPYVAAFGYPED